jgi:hypothetical protein
MKLQEITLNHVKTHGFKTVSEFLTKYNLSTNKSQYHCDRIKGENNPAYHHGGKNSPFSENYIAYDKLTEEEKKQKIKNIYNKIHN